MPHATPPGPLPWRQFASDNYAGICPEAWDALADANRGHARAYGEDAWTARVSDQIRDLFEIDCDVFFTFNGTAANSLALAALCRSYHGIICSEVAHIETDECGAPEFFSGGTKILLAAGPEGKVTPESVTECIQRRQDIHYPKPRVLSLTQPTEVGTLYSEAELDRLSEVARKFDLRVHMDGARFANAIAALGVSPKEITWKVGVDVLCFGGTKLGLPVGDAVVFFNRRLSEEFDYRCKQAGQLASKMRFMSAPWLGMLHSGAWLRHAQHANARATELAAALNDVPQARLLYPAQANAVFVQLPAPAIRALRDRGWVFYTFIGGGARFMCSWDTTREDVEALVADVRQVCG